MSKKLKYWADACGQCNPSEVQAPLFDGPSLRPLSDLLGSLGFYDPPTDSWANSPVIPRFAVDAAKAIANKRREVFASQAPPKWGQIVRKTLDHNLPGLPEDVREALVTLGLWIKVINPATAKDPVPLLGSRVIDHVWSCFARAIARFFKESEKCQESKNSATTSEPAPT